jgi:hypothetical protein
MQTAHPRALLLLREARLLTCDVDVSVLFGAVCFSGVWRCLIFLPQPTGKLAIGCITIFISREDAPASAAEHSEDPRST